MSIENNTNFRYHDHGIVNKKKQQQKTPELVYPPSNTLCVTDSCLWPHNPSD